MLLVRVAEEINAISEMGWLRTINLLQIRGCWWNIVSAAMCALDNDQEVIGCAPRLSESVIVEIWVHVIGQRDCSAAARKQYVTDANIRHCQHGYVTLTSSHHVSKLFFWVEQACALKEFLRISDVWQYSSYASSGDNTSEIPLFLIAFS